MPDPTVQTATQPAGSTPSLPRVFRFGEDHTWADPGPDFSNDDVRRHLATFFPELAAATIAVTVEGDHQVVTFKKQAGTKGQDEPNASLARFVDALVPILEQESRLAWGPVGVRRIVRWALNASNLTLTPRAQAPEGNPADA